MVALGQQAVRITANRGGVAFIDARPQPAVGCPSFDLGGVLKVRSGIRLLWGIALAERSPSHPRNHSSGPVHLLVTDLKNVEAEVGPHSRLALAVARGEWNIHPWSERDCNPARYDFRDIKQSGLKSAEMRPIWRDYSSDCWTEGRMR
jgi:hypothetical protein